MAAAARVGVQAVPVRQLDPVTGPAKRERAAEAVNERKAASDSDRLEMLRLGRAAPRRRRDHRPLQTQHEGPEDRGPRTSQLVAGANPT